MDRCPLTIVEDQVSDFNDHASLICCAIDIVDKDWIGEQACRDVIQPCPFNVDEVADCTTVNEGLGASLDCCICQFDLYVNGKRH
jgi:hypothetical protein